MHIPFNRPYFTGKEIDTMIKAAMAGQISGNGLYTRKCHKFLEKKYSFHKTLLTHSCTAALEMSAILADIKPGDEVIVPSFTFVSTANAFVLRGATIRFADSSADHPNINVEQLESLINDKTRAIVVVHYAGVACDMDPVIELARKKNIVVIEDAAHAIDANYKGRPLGGIGHFGAFSYHETKNIISGEGGALVVNDPAFDQRAEIIWEKGTNRVAFKRGEVKKYEWVDVGSSFLPSEVISAILYSQLMEVKNIQKKRTAIWRNYRERLHDLEEAGAAKLPFIPGYASNNGHMFYLVTGGLEERNKLLKHLKKKNIHAVFHYIPLHSSPYYIEKHDGRDLPMAKYYSERIIRLPFFFEITTEQQDRVTSAIKDFYGIS